MENRDLAPANEKNVEMVGTKKVWDNKLNELDNRKKVSLGNRVANPAIHCLVQVANLDQLGYAIKTNVF